MMRRIVQIGLFEQRPRQSSYGLVTIFHDLYGCPWNWIPVRA